MKIMVLNPSLVNTLTTITGAFILGIFIYNLHRAKELKKEGNEYYESNNWNTGEETEKRKKRFEEAVKIVEKTFDPSKIGGVYKYGDFIENLLEDISQEEKQRIVFQKHVQ